MKKTNKKTLREKGRKCIYPSAIQTGDTIGLVAPAGSLVDRNLFTAGVEILEKNGFRVKFNRKFLNSSGYLAGSDVERADNFNNLWSDPEVKALVAVRGGYGSLRMVDLIDMRLIRKNPKILIGFSDLTVLLAAIHKKTKLVTYHGPVVTTLAEINKQSLTSFFRTLKGKTPDSLKLPKINILKNGNAKGVLLGGNLTTLAHMIGTPYEIPWENAILFIEDTGESAYRLDRLLTHLEKAKGLQKIKGLILGTFTDDERKERSALQRAVIERILEIFKGTNTPVWSNFSSGHSRRNLTLPVGVEAQMSSSSNILYFRQ
jgi:muramoyltetrapeptide carboxypeptidase